MVKGLNNYFIRKLKESFIYKINARELKSTFADEMNQTRCNFKAASKKYIKNKQISKIF